MTIDGNGFGGGILASGTQGVIINATNSGGTDPERKVTLRRIQINGTGATGGGGARTGTNGINIISANAVHVENCYIQNFTTTGINMSVTESLDSLSVKDTNIQNCQVGISMTTTTGSLLGIFDRVRVEKITTTGIAVGPHTHLSIRESLVSNNGGDGISINGSSSDSSVFTESSMVNHNGTGIRNGANGSSVILSNTNVQGNSTGLATAGGVFTSHGNNEISGNASPGTAAGVIGQQ